MRAGEPSGPIQLIPPGLLGLLQIKSPAGQNPNVLNADVQPVIDLEPWWLRANQNVWPDNGGITAGPGASNGFIASSPGTILVPQNEWWYVHAFTSAVQCQATCMVSSVRPGMLYNQTGTLKFQTLGTDTTPIFMDATYGVLHISAFDFWAPPGAELGWVAGTISVADVDITLRGMTFTRCPI